MNSFERVINRLSGQAVDRVPYTLLTTLWAFRLISGGMKAYSSRPESYALAQSLVAEKLQTDILFGPFFLAYEGAAFGSEIKFFENADPNIQRPLPHPELLFKKGVPSIKNTPGLNYILECNRLLAEKYKSEIPVAAILNSPTDQPALIFGIESWIDMLLFQPEIAQKVLEITGNFFVGFANELLKSGVACVVTPMDFSNPSIITAQMNSEIMLPALKKYFAQVQGPIVIHHGGSRMEPFLPVWKELPNIAAFVIDHRDDFTRSRQTLGEGKNIFGNINSLMLSRGNPENIHKKVTELLYETREDKNFFLCTSGGGIPADTPEENLGAIRDAVLNHK